MKPGNALRAVKLIHTAIWAFFVACILAIPVYSHAGRFEIAGGLVAIVMFEVLILAINRCRCPLTGIAARHTEDRAPNFDIYLPAWIARHNKLIFGSLFLAGALLTLFEWVNLHGTT